MLLLYLHYVTYLYDKLVNIRLIAILMITYTYKASTKELTTNTRESINNTITYGWRNAWNVKKKAVSVASNSIIVLMCNVM